MSDPIAGARAQDSGRPMDSSVAGPAAGLSNTRARAALPPRRRIARIVLQAGGFLVGLGLLWWCGAQALAPENRAQIERLSTAPAGDVAMLAGLSAATIILNGLMFWVTVRPVARLGAGSVVATNALATFLNYLPFKLSVLARVLVHTRRDRVPLLTVGAWFAAVAVVLLGVYGPLMGVSLWRRGIDGVWWIAGGGGIVLLLAMVVVVARALAGERGRARLRASVGHIRPRGLSTALGRFAESRAFARLHAGFNMLGSWRSVAAAAGLRVADIGVQALRFVVAAGVLGLALSWQDAVLVACTYFLIGVASPWGQLGTRELGTRWLAGVLGLAGGESLAVVVLLVSAVESVVSLALAGVAIAWLRPDRLIGVGAGGAGGAAENAPEDAGIAEAARPDSPAT